MILVNNWPIRCRVLAFVLVAVAVAWGTVIGQMRATAAVRRHIDLGIAAARRAEARQAETEWRTAISLDPRNKEAWYLLSQIYLSTQDWQRGAEAFRCLIEVDPDVAHVHGNLATCLYESGRRDEAYREAREEIKRDPAFVPALLIAVRVASELKQEREEDTYFRQLIVLDADNAVLLRFYAQYLLNHGRYVAAKPIAERLIHAAPADALAYSLRGMATFNTDPSPAGNASAEADFRQTVRLSPTIPLAHLYLGKLHRRRGDVAAALTELESAYKLVPDQIAVCYELAQAYAQAGQLDRAARVRLTLGVLQRDDDRRNILEKRCVSDAQNYDIHLELGRLLAKRGDYVRAYSYLDRAAALRPSDVPARAERDRVRSILRRAGAGQDVTLRLMAQKIALPKNL